MGTRGSGTLSPNPAAKLTSVHEHASCGLNLVLFGRSKPRENQEMRQQDLQAHIMPTPGVTLDEEIIPIPPSPISLGSLVGPRHSHDG